MKKKMKKLYLKQQPHKPNLLTELADKKKNIKIEIINNKNTFFS